MSQSPASDAEADCPGHVLANPPRGGKNRAAGTRIRCRSPELAVRRGARSTLKRNRPADAMPMPVSKPKRTLTAAQFVARFDAEKARQQLRYSEALALWRFCANKRCRRERACRGDAHACLLRAVSGVPRQRQWQARKDILAATPRNIGAPERAVRACMPLDLCAHTAAQALADYLALRATRRALLSPRAVGSSKSTIPSARSGASESPPMSAEIPGPPE